MSTLVDEKIVSMKFDSAQFERGVQSAIQSTNNLKKNLNFDDTAESMSELSRAASRVNMDPLLNSIRSIGDSFNAAGIVAFSVINRMTNAAIDAGVKITKALTITPMKTGLSEYELKMNSTQTIMSSTGKSIDEVNGYLKELNEYSDRTIYSFADMTSNIGKFTNAGVELGDAVNAMRGLMNEAAISGANAAEASRAMYNLAQSMSMGYVQLIDWKSIENANMATIAFKRNLAETAVDLKGIQKIGEDLYQVGDKTFTIQQLFKDGLQSQWLTKDVLTKTLIKYQDETTELGRQGYAAAQDLKTFTQMVDTLKEALQSGWAETWQQLFGNLDQAKVLWTTIGTGLNNLIGKIDNYRNKILEIANGLGMRENMFQSLKNVMKAFGQILYAIQVAFERAFGEKESHKNVTAMGFFVDMLLRLSKAIREFTEGLILTSDEQNDLVIIFEAVFSTIKTLIVTFQDLYGVIKNALGITEPFAVVLRKIVVTAAGVIIVINKILQKTKIISGTLKLVATLLGLIAVGLVYLVESIIDVVANMPTFGQICDDIYKSLLKLSIYLEDSEGVIPKLLNNIFVKPFAYIVRSLNKIDFIKIPKLIIGALIISFTELKNVMHGLFSGESIDILTPVKNAFTGVANFIGGFNWMQVLKVSGFFAAMLSTFVMLANITKLIDAIWSFASTLRNLGNAISDVMRSFANFINAQAFDMFTESLKKIGIVIAAIAGLSLVFGILKEDNFNRAMVAMERLAIVVSTATAVIISIWYIMGTIKTMGTASSVNGFADALAVIGKSFATGVTVSLRTVSRGVMIESILTGIAISMVGMAVSLSIITRTMDSVDIDKVNSIDVLYTSLASLVASVMALSMTAKLISDKNVSENINSMTLQMLAISASMLLMAVAIERLKDVDWKVIGEISALIAIMGIEVAGLLIAANYLNMKGTAAPATVLAGAAMVMSMALALDVLTASLYVLAMVPFPSLLKSGIAVGLMMFGLTTTIMTLTYATRSFTLTAKGQGSVLSECIDALNALGLSAIILSLAGAIWILSDCLQRIGEIDSEVIQNGLLRMAGIMVAFTAFALVLVKMSSKALGNAGTFFLGLALLLPSFGIAIKRIESLDWVSASAKILAMSTAILAMGAAINLAGEFQKSKGIKAFAGLSLAITALSLSMIALTFVDPSKMLVVSGTLSLAMLALGEMFKWMSKIGSAKTVIATMLSIAGIFTTLLIVGKIAQDPGIRVGLAAITLNALFLIQAMGIFTKRINAIAASDTLKALGLFVLSVGALMISLGAASAFIEQSGGIKSVLVVLGSMTYLTLLVLAISKLMTGFDKVSANALPGRNDATKITQSFAALAVVMTGMGILMASLGIASKFAKGNMKTVIALSLVTTGLTALLFAVSELAAGKLQGKTFANATNTLKSLGILLLGMSLVMVAVTMCALAVSHFDLIDEVVLLSFGIAALGLAVGSMLEGIRKTADMKANEDALKLFYSVLASLVLVMSGIGILATTVAKHNVSDKTLALITGSIFAITALISGIMLAMANMSKGKQTKKDKMEPEDIKMILSQVGIILAEIGGLIAGIIIATKYINVDAMDSVKAAVAYGVGVAAASVTLLAGMAAIKKEYDEFEVEEDDIKSIGRTVTQIGLFITTISAALTVASRYLNSDADIENLVKTSSLFFGACEVLLAGVVGLAKLMSMLEGEAEDAEESEEGAEEASGGLDIDEILKKLIAMAAMLGVATLVLSQISRISPSDTSNVMSSVMAAIVLFGASELLIAGAAGLSILSSKYSLTTEQLTEALIEVGIVAVALATLAVILSAASGLMQEGGKLIGTVSAMVLISLEIGVLALALAGLGALLGELTGGMGVVALLIGLAVMGVVTVALWGLAALLVQMNNTVGGDMSAILSFSMKLAAALTFMGIAAAAATMAGVSYVAGIIGAIAGMAFAVATNQFLKLYSEMANVFGESIPNIIQFSLNLSELFLSLVPAFASLAALAVFGPFAVVGAVAASLAIGALTGLIFEMQFLDSIVKEYNVDFDNTIIPFAESLTKVCDALMPVAISLAAVGALSSLINKGTGSILIVLAGVIVAVLELAAIGALFDKFGETILSLADWLNKIGSKLTNTVFNALDRLSKFVTAISKANLFKLMAFASITAINPLAISGFAMILLGLSKYGFALKKYVDSVKGIDDSDFAPAKTGIEFLNNITEAVSKINNTAFSLIGFYFGNNDLGQLAEGLAAYADAMFGSDGYVEKMKNVDVSDIEEGGKAVKGIQFLKTITQAMTGFVWTSGSVLGLLIGTNDFGKLATPLASYAAGLNSFNATLNEGLDYDKMRTAIMFLPTIALASLGILDTKGSVLGFLIGNRDFSYLGPALESYGIGLATYSNAIKNVDFEKASEGIDFLIKMALLSVTFVASAIMTIGEALIYIATGIATALFIIFSGISTIVEKHEETVQKVVDYVGQIWDSGIKDIFDLLDKTIGSSEWVETVLTGLTDFTLALADLTTAIKEFIVEMDKLDDDDRTNGFQILFKSLSDIAGVLGTILELLRGIVELANPLLMVAETVNGLDPAIFQALGMSPSETWAEWTSQNEKEAEESGKKIGESHIKGLHNSIREGYEELPPPPASAGSIDALMNLRAPQQRTKAILQARKLGELLANSETEGYVNERLHGRPQRLRNNATTLLTEESTEASGLAGLFSGTGFGEGFLEMAVAKLSTFMDFLVDNLPPEVLDTIEGLLGWDPGTIKKSVDAIKGGLEALKNGDWKKALGDTLSGFGIDIFDEEGNLNVESLTEKAKEALGLNGFDNTFDPTDPSGTIDEKEKERLLSENQYWADLLEIRKNGVDGWKYQDMELADFQQQILDETQSMYDEYFNNLESSYNSFLGSNIFSEVDMGFDPENPFTKDEMFQNLQDQITQLDRYTNVMNSLNDRIDTDELRATINAMGVDSIEELETLNSLSEAELDNYEAMYVSKMESAHRAAVAANDQSYRDTVDGINKLLGTSLDGDAIMQMFDGTMASLDNIVTANQVKMANIGTDINAGIAEGMTSKEGMAIIDGATSVLADGTENYVREHLKSHSPAQRMVPVGEDIVKGISVGMTNSNSMTSIKASSALVAAWYESEIKSKRAGFFNSGIYLMRGLSEGIESGKEGVLKAIERFSGKLKSTFETDQEIESPSKVWMEYGKYIDEGLANGILNNTGTAEDAIHRMSSQTLGIMQNAMSSAYDAMNSESIPAITPVVNMNKLQNGIRTMDTALAAQRSYLMANAANASIDTSVHKEVSINNQAAVDAITRLNGDILNLGDRLANMQIMLDTGIVAGQMAPAMNSELGTIMSRSIREGVG